MWDWDQVLCAGFLFGEVMSELPGEGMKKEKDEIRKKEKGLKLSSELLTPVGRKAQCL